MVTSRQAPENGIEEIHFHMPRRPCTTDAIKAAKVASCRYLDLKEHVVSSKSIQGGRTWQPT